MIGSECFKPSAVYSLGTNRFGAGGFYWCILFAAAISRVENFKGYVHHSQEWHEAFDEEWTKL